MSTVRVISLFVLVLAVLICQPLLAQTPTPTRGNPAPTIANTDNFHFAIFSDLTDSERLGVFSSAVTKMNLLQPDFVINIGDTIQGYTKDVAEATREYDDFDARLAKLQMPFHRVTGNHDVCTDVLMKMYKERYGSVYTHFVYKNVLFLCLNSQDKLDSDDGFISDEQVAYVQKTLAANANVRWTLVFMHQPLWDGYQGSNWEKVEALLKGRPYTVFTGHYHDYEFDVRNGQKYFILATTGGVSGMRGPLYGEFDHLAWVTMTDKGPIVANLMLDGIADESIRTVALVRETRKLEQNTLASYTPLYVAKNNFRGASMQLRCANDTDDPEHLTVNFPPHKDLHPSPASFTLDLPPHAEKLIDLKLTGSRTIPADTADGLMMEMHATYKLSDGRTFDPGIVRQHITPVGVQECRRSSGPVTVDGKLDEWKSLPYTLEKPLELINTDAKLAWKSAQDGNSRFGVCYDDQYLYVAVETTDKTVVSEPGVEPWRQDGIEIRLDARPDPTRGICRGQGENSDFLFIPLSPGATADGTVNIAQKDMPAGLRAVCVKTATGYNTEVAIPVDYLNKKFGGPWQAFRLNIMQDQCYQLHGAMSYIYWRPDWRRELSYPGSGTFVRK